MLCPPLPPLPWKSPHKIKLLQKANPPLKGVSSDGGLEIMIGMCYKRSPTGWLGTSFEMRRVKLWRMSKTIKPAAFSSSLLLLCSKPVSNDCPTLSTTLDMAHKSRPRVFLLIFRMKRTLWGSKIKHFEEQRSISFLGKLLMFHAWSTGCQGEGGLFRNSLRNPHKHVDPMQQNPT